MTTAPRRTAARYLAVAALASGALLLTACGSSSDDGSESKGPATAAQKACVEKAKAYLKDWESFPTTLPESPPARYTKLPQKPAPGKTIVYIRQNFPAGASTVDGMEQGAKFLDWKVKSVIFDNSLPDFLAKLDTVIAEKPDFISWSGFPAAAAQKQIDAAKAAGINVVISSTPDEPVSSPGLAGVGNSTGTVKQIGQINANKMLVDSGCTGNTVVFSLDYPIIEVGTEEYKRVVSEACPSCKIDVVTIQAKDIGTPAMTQQMVSKLQADPSFKYANPVIGDLASGLAQSLKTAGIEDVRIFGAVPNEDSFAALRNGTNAWWVNQSSTINGLDTIDMAARVAATGELQTDEGGYPLALLTPDNVPAGETKPVIPSNIADLYAEGWSAK